MSMPQVGQMLIFSGALLIAFGIMFSGKLGPLGRLPGDIIIERSNFTFFLPLTSIILLNIIVIAIAWFVRH